MGRCTILTDEGIHFITRLALFCRPIDTPKERFLATEYWSTPSPLYSFVGIEEGDRTKTPRVTQKPDIPLEGIWDPIPWKPHNLLKRIRNLVPNRIQNQRPRGFIIPT